MSKKSYLERAFRPNVTLNFLHGARAVVEEGQEELLLDSPYGEVSPEDILSHEPTSDLLTRGFIDQWNRRWRLTHIDGTQRQPRLQFRVAKSFLARVKSGLGKLVHPHAT
ncbi:hypothetical protein HY312_01235 [Candidatus Saccharibacteria bacterium]|nr:hypothetical protein [Candidatus Saccharibacteria bacterium]